MQKLKVELVRRGAVVSGRNKDLVESYVVFCIHRMRFLCSTIHLSRFMQLVATPTCDLPTTYDGPEAQSSRRLLGFRGPTSKGRGRVKEGEGREERRGREGGLEAPPPFVKS